MTGCLLYNVVHHSICIFCGWNESWYGFMMGNSPLCPAPNTHTHTNYWHISSVSIPHRTEWECEFSRYCQKKEIPIIKIDDSNKNLFPFFAIFSSYIFYWFPILLPVHPLYISFSFLPPIEFGAFVLFVYLCMHGEMYNFWWITSKKRMQICFFFTFCTWWFGIFGYCQSHRVSVSIKYHERNMKKTHCQNKCWLHTYDDDRKQDTKWSDVRYKDRHFGRIMILRVFSEIDWKMWTFFYCHIFVCLCIHIDRQCGIVEP